ncbi:MAG: hypothetical protein ACKVQC_01405 [Elusimicrobiota bacterium]
MKNSIFQKRRRFNIALTVVLGLFVLLGAFVFIKGGNLIPVMESFY